MKIINDLDFKKQARELNVKIWQAPSFLFLMMGIVIIIAMTATYFVSKNYDSPETLALAECVIVAVIFIIGNSVIREIEQFAKLNKMKSEFVSVASHQLRTPLSAINWGTELLFSKFDEGLSDKQKETIRNINQLGKKMMRLVNDLLDVTKIDQGSLILKKEKFNLVKLAKEVVENMLPLARVHNVQIIFGDNHEEFLVFGDPEKIRLVVENLLSNAVKYNSDKGRVEIDFKTKNGLVICSIKDNGVGIPEGQQEQVFEKFFRSDNSVKYQTEGTGLGLYIAKNIIKQSGGEIWFWSKEKKGSVFNFSLPAYSQSNTR